MHIIFSLNWYFVVWCVCKGHEMAEDITCRLQFILCLVEVKWGGGGVQGRSSGWNQCRGEKKRPGCWQVSRDQ